MRSQSPLRWLASLRLGILQFLFYFLHQILHFTAQHPRQRDKVFRLSLVDVFLTLLVLLDGRCRRLKTSTPVRYSKPLPVS